MMEQQKIYNQQQKKQDLMQKGNETRDEKGRIIFTGPERKLMDHLIKYCQNGLIKYQIFPQFRVQYGNTEYPLDFAIPALKIALEADGEIFHGSPKQVQHDKERDMKLAQLGWTVVRFGDEDIDKRTERVMSDVVKTIMQKEMALGKLKKQVETK